MSNTHTKTHNNINNKKTNTEMNTNTDTNTTMTPTANTTSARRMGLKVGAVTLSLVALCLSYQAANEAVALYGVLDKVQDTLAAEQMIKAQAASVARISETNPSVAGL